MSSFDYGKYHIETLLALFSDVARAFHAAGLKMVALPLQSGDERPAEIDAQMHKLWGSEDPQDIQRFKDLHDELREVYKCLIQEYIKTAKQPA